MATVQSVERAFTVLRALAGGPAGVSDIADRTNLPKSTVARLLATLVDVGVVEQGRTGMYGLGRLVIELAASASPGDSLIAIARPHLVELVEQIGEAAGLGVLAGSEVYYCDQVDTDHQVQVRDWTGSSVDFHVVSSGLVLAAFAPQAVRRTLLSGPLRAWTAHSVTDGEELRHRLVDVRRAGFAWVHEEMSEGLNSVAAPIVNPSGTAIAAIHAHGPSYRFPARGSEDAISQAVIAAGRRISARLAARHVADDTSAVVARQSER